MNQLSASAAFASIFRAWTLNSFVHEIQMKTDSEVTVQDQTIQMNPIFQSNRAFTRPNGTKFTHLDKKNGWMIDIYLDWKMFSVSLLPLFHFVISVVACVMANRLDSIFFPFLFGIIHFEYWNIIEGVTRCVVVHTKSNKNNTTAMANDNTKKECLLSRVVPFIICTVLVINHILPYLDRSYASVWVECAKPHIVVAVTIICQQIFYHILGFLSHFLPDVYAMCSHVL